MPTQLEQSLTGAGASEAVQSGASAAPPPRQESFRDAHAATAAGATAAGGATAQGGTATAIAAEERRQAAIVQAFRERGYSIPDDVQDDEAFFSTFDRTLEDYDSQIQQAQRDPLVGYGRTYLQHQKEFESWLAEKQKTQQAQQAAAAPAAPERAYADWQAPEYDPGWERFCEVNRQLGRWVLTDEARRAGVNPAIADKLTEAALWERERQRQLAREAPTMMRKIAAELIAEELAKEREARQQEVRQTIEQTQRATATASYAEQYVHQHRAELFVLHPDGSHVMAQDQAGNPVEVMTPRGQALWHFTIEARQKLRDPTPDEVFAYALDRTDAWHHRELAKAAAKKPPAPPAGKVNGHSAAAGAANGSAGAATEPEAPRDKKGRFVDRGRHAGSPVDTGSRDQTAIEERNGGPPQSRRNTFARLHAQIKRERAEGLAD